MTLSDDNQKALMLTIHQKVEEYADSVADSLNKGDIEDLTYPPNCGLTGEELNALQKLKDDPTLKSALRKVLADNSAGVVFDIFNLVDGTADPDENLGNWTEIALVDKSEELDDPIEMLHDNFYSTYWDWKKIRPNNGWKLDTNEA